MRSASGRARRRPRVHDGRSDRVVRVAGARRQDVRERAAATRALLPHVRHPRWKALGWRALAITVGFAVLTRIRSSCSTCCCAAARARCIWRCWSGAGKLPGKRPSRLGLARGRRGARLPHRRRAVLAGRSSTSRGRRAPAGSRGYDRARQLLDAARGTDQHVPAAVLRYARQLLGTERHPFPQRIHRRRRSDARRLCVRRRGA